MADETRSISPLQVDRGLPLGNSDDAFGRRSVHTKIGNKPTEPIPVGNPGTPYFKDGASPTDPGNPVTLIDDTVPLGTTRMLSQILASCSVSGYLEVTAAGQVIATGRTAPGKTDILIPFNPPRPIPENIELKVTFTARLSTPVASVESYIQANDVL
jgi:hypothetical protein